VATEAFITPGLVRWARERVRRSPEEAASRLGVKPEQWEAWESGDRRPTLRQAQALARSLYIPFGYLYLPTPPAEQLPLPDLRTVGDEAPGRPSAELSDVLNDAIRKQSWYREHLEREGSAPLPFIGRYSLDDKIETIAEDIVNTLDISDSVRSQSKDPDQFLRSCVRRVESAGVLVLRSSYVAAHTRRPLTSDEFRGFVISDDLAPLVFINSQDKTVAEVFTLAHEIAHLWFNQSGISNLDYSVPIAQDASKVEARCNRVAAEVLMPAKGFLSRWRDDVDPLSAIGDLARYYKVSRRAVLKRAYEVGRVNSSQRGSLYARIVATTRPPRDNGDSGNFYPSVVIRNSRTFTTSLIASVYNGDTSPLDAARLLNVKADKLRSISEYIFGDRASA
jgi:Zn-dependent peptidase ImmA (M78 family)/DNA-binding XRE family transcriptional regulator